MNFENNSHNFCSPLQTERYLLNRMTEEEETLFQQHLDTCETCRSYLKRVRDLSQAFREDDRPQTTLSRLRPLKRPPVRYFFRAAAAGVLLVVGLSVFLSRRGQEYDGAHDLQIEHQHRAAVDYADALEVSSPAQPVCTLDVRTTPLIFRWNRVTDYRLRITSGNRLVFTLDSVGDRYAPEPAAIAPYDSLEWTLEADETIIRGKIVVRD
jgi:hypothetical protein